tara:strand:+ start:2870 stop:3526 length:657 start_codon:yes stop_codon:yes gene_type:complete
MSKKILIAGASGLLGSKILNKLDCVANEIILLARTKIDCDERIIQIQTDFENLQDINTQPIDDVYIAIGTKLSLSELLYIKKSKRDDFKKVDFEYVKNIASFGKRCGAKSLSFISAIGANNRSLNTYLNVKGSIENRIIKMNFDKTIIARPSHLLGKRKNEAFDIAIFEVVTNFTGLFLFGPFKKFRNIDAAKVANAVVDSMDNQQNGLKVLEYKDFK